MNRTPFNKTGLETLLTPENSAVILIDYQGFQFAGVNSHDPQTIVNNVVGLAKTAKVFKLLGQADRIADRKETNHVTHLDELA